MWLLTIGCNVLKIVNTMEPSMFSQCMWTHVSAENDMGALGVCHHKINSKWKTRNLGVILYYSIQLQEGKHIL